jgi:MSHA type pilus biogenesis protein MshL
MKSLLLQRSMMHACALSSLLTLLATSISSAQVQEVAQVPTPGQKIQEELVPGFHRERKRFSLNLKDAKLREVLLLLTKDTGYNLIVDPAVDGDIRALDLKDVTFEEALEAIIPSLGLEYHLGGNMLRVNRPALETRIFYLNYIAVNRTGTRDMRLTSRSQTGESSNVMMAGMSGVVGAGGGGQGVGSGQGSGGSQSENESKLNTATRSQLWQDVRDGLMAILFPGSAEGAAEEKTGEDRGPEGFARADANGRRLLINPQAGLIMVHAENSVIDEAGCFLEAVEGSVQRQVLIEAKIVEVTLSKDYQLGVNWSAILNPTSSFTGLLPNVLGVTNPSAGLSLGTPINQNVNPSIGSFQYGVTNSKVGVLIDALSRQGQLRVLSSPRLSTLNNQKAVIRVVREDVFFTQSSMASIGVGGNLTTQNIINQIVPIGVVMEIIPQIGATGDITLSVNPSISELVEVKTFAASSGAAVSTQPVIDRRDLDTVAKVKSGQTLLIAGIMRERRAEDLRGIPWLMNLPVVGGAFRRTEQSSQRTELVILITPTLLVGKRIEDLTEEAQERIEKMQKNLKLGTVDSFKGGIKGEVTNR